MLVTGATGTLGRLVAERLTRRGRPVVAASRRPRPSSASAPASTSVLWRVADLRASRGWEPVMDGVEAIVHCATSNTSADLAMTRHLIDAPRHGGVHMVYPSIVGVDRIALGYYRATLACERALADSGLPWSVLRSTQFHELVDSVMGVASLLPVLVLPTGTSFQPVAAAEVADELAALAVAPAAGRVPDLAGPAVVTTRELACEYLRARRR